MKLGRDSHKWLSKKAKAGPRHFPAGTVAFYGPDNRRASKAVAGIVTERGAEPAELRKWFSEDGDVRTEAVFDEIVAFLKSRDVHQVAMVDRIFGCPHEEGKDYPLGEKCTQCPYWATHDRYQQD